MWAVHHARTYVEVQVAPSFNISLVLKGKIYLAPFSPQVVMCASILFWVLEDFVVQYSILKNIGEKDITLSSHLSIPQELPFRLSSL